MPFSEYNNMLDIYNIKRLPEFPDPSEVDVKRLVKRDLPDTEECKVHIIKSGTILTGVVEGCIGCKKCMKICPERAISIEPEGNAGYRANIESDRCGGTACRRCEAECPKRVLHTAELKVKG
jgi:NAD-dependent dihydropyrimidine dehydrogenase PreA subunit